MGSLKLHWNPLCLVVYGTFWQRVIGGMLGWLCNMPGGKNTPALAFFLFVFLDPSLRGDRGILEHELTHIRQGLRLLRYNNLEERRRIETEAYKEQLKWVKDPESAAVWFALSIAHGYGLNLTTNEVYYDLTGKELFNEQRPLFV